MGGCSKTLMDFGVSHKDLVEMDTESLVMRIHGVCNPVQAIWMVPPVWPLAKAPRWLTRMESM